MERALPDKKRRLLQALLEKEGLTQASGAIPARPPGERPLSFAQERLWYLARLTPDTPAYNIPLAWHLHGELNIPALQNAFNELTARHEILRTRFPEGDAPTQEFAASLQVPLALLDLTNTPPGDLTPQIDQRLKVEAHTPFDLARPPLIRVKLLHLSPTHHLLLITIHHLLADGWSLAILLNEISALYHRFTLSGGRPERADAVEGPTYADFAHWQRARAASPDLTPQLNYWQKKLAALPDPLELPTDHPRPAIQTFNGRWLAQALPPETAAALRALTKTEGVTLLAVVLAAFKTLLHRYTGQDDILIGSPVTNRVRTELEGLVGHFVNTQALRTDLSGDPAFRALIQRTRQTIVEAFANQDVPFEKLLDGLQTGRDPGKNPLFQVVFILQDAPAHAHWRSALQLDGLAVENTFTHSDTAKFDLTVEVEDLPAGLTVSFEYSTDLFEEATIARMGGHYATLLAGAAANPDTRLSELPLLTAAELAQLAAWNQTATVYPRHETIQALFEAQAAHTPEAIALTFEGQHLAYAELNRRANFLAHTLRGLGIGPDVMVGIACERSFELIVGILGVLKAGGAYVPLDMNYPAERLAFMLADTRAPVLLVQEKFQGLLPPHEARVIPLGGLPEGDDANPKNLSSPENPAYVMYTSGSTGRPKGAAIPQRGVVRLVRDTNFAELGREEVFFQFSPVSFDASTLEIWGALLNGGRLVIPPPGQMSFEALGELIRAEGVTLLWLTAGLFREMVERYPQGLARVRQLFTGGDVVSPAHVRQMLAHMEGGRVVNGYGPTENTTFTATYPMLDAGEVGATLPIGRPIANTTIHILDRNLGPVPVGIVGELYTGGDGLARGYLGQPGLTAERFVPLPPLLAGGARGGSRVYKTGDLARWRADGVIEFLGRRDFQVKLRGFRIELGEIEAALAAQPGVRAGAVVANTASGDKRLIAYVIPEGEPVPTVDSLRTGLVAALPDYMIPAAFVFLETFPLDPNGKLDRRSLPEPPSDRPALGTAFLAPQTAAEQKIAAIWREVLAVEQVGLDDNFFDLGGHSLLMLQVHSRLKAAYADLPMMAMFTHPTVRSMARHLGGAESAPQTAEDDVRARGAARRERMGRRRG